MLRHCIDAARRLGYRRCYLETLTGMDAAMRLYERMGFEVQTRYRILEAPGLPAEGRLAAGFVTALPYGGDDRRDGVAVQGPPLTAMVLQAARFDLPRFNALYERQRVLPDGPERLALMTAAKKLTQ